MIIGLDIYDDAIVEYLDSIEQTVLELQEQFEMCNKLVEHARQSAEKSIRKYLEKLMNVMLDFYGSRTLKVKDKQIYSLTEIAQKNDKLNLSYIIQSWLRKDNTLELLSLWEK